MKTQQSSTRLFTDVMLPRFEYEALDGGELINRAEPRPWLPCVEIESLLDPKAIASETRKDLKGKWVGVYHTGRIFTTQPRFYRSPVTHTDEMYRAVYTTHDYSWDPQNLPGRGTEVVLERATPYQPTYIEELALYVRHSYGRHPDQQRLVMADPTTGEWREPGFRTEDMRRDFCLAVMIHLATREGAIALTPSHSS